MEKTIETTHSIYGFLVEVWLKTILDRPVKAKEENVARVVPKEKKNVNQEKEEGI